MELTGKVIAILQANSGVSARTGNPWMSQEYVIEVPGQFPRKMMFRVFGEDRIKQFNIQAGKEITVQFDIDAHEYNGRWFNEIRAFSVTPAGEGTIPAATSVPGTSTAPAGTPFPPQQNGAPIAAAPFPPAQEPAEEDSADNLPF